jgi:hypothetical protein
LRIGFYHVLPLKEAIQTNQRPGPERQHTFLHLRREFIQHKGKAFVRSMVNACPIAYFNSLNFCNYLAGSLSGSKNPIFRHISQFFYSGAATDCKKSLRLAKNGSFFVSDATG